MRRLKSKFKKMMILVYFMAIMTFLAVASDVVVKNGEMNITSNLVVDTNTLYVDSTNNKVGIGTATPAKQLHVIGDANFTGNVSIGGQITDTGASRCAIYMSANQALNSGAWYKLQFDTERYDNLGEFNTATYQFTPLQSGYYLVMTKATLNPGGVGTEWRVAIRINGAEYSSSLNGLGPTFAYQQGISDAIVYLTAGQNVSVYGYHNCGVAKNAVGGGNVNELSIQRLS